MERFCKISWIGRYGYEAYCMVLSDAMVIAYQIAMYHNTDVIIQIWNL